MLLTVSLICSTTKAEAQWKQVPQGQTITASEDIVIGNKETLKKTVEVIKSTKAERDAWKEAYNTVSKDMVILAVSVDAQLEELEAQLNSERKAHKREANKRAVKLLFLGMLVGGLIASN